MDHAQETAERLYREWDELGLVNPGKIAGDKLVELLAAALRDYALTRESADRTLSTPATGTG